MEKGTRGNNSYNNYCSVTQDVFGNSRHCMISLVNPFINRNTIRTKAEGLSTKSGKRTLSYCLFKNVQHHKLMGTSITCNVGQDEL